MITSLISTTRGGPAPSAPHQHRAHPRDRLNGRTAHDLDHLVDSALALFEQFDRWNQQLSVFRQPAGQFPAVRRALGRAGKRSCTVSSSSVASPSSVSAPDWYHNQSAGVATDIQLRLGQPRSHHRYPHFEETRILEPPLDRNGHRIRLRARSETQTQGFVHGIAFATSSRVRWLAWAVQLHTNSAPDRRRSQCTTFSHCRRFPHHRATDEGEGRTSAPSPMTVVPPTATTTASHSSTQRLARVINHAVSRNSWKRAGSTVLRFEHRIILRDIASATGTPARHQLAVRSSPLFQLHKPRARSKGGRNVQRSRTADAYRNIPLQTRKGRCEWHLRPCLLPAEQGRFLATCTG